MALKLTITEIFFFSPDLIVIVYLHGYYSQRTFF